MKRSLVFPILLFSSISLHWSVRKAFLSLLAFLWSSAFRWVYFSFLISFLLLFFSQLFVRPPQTTILPFCIYFSLGWSWSPPPITVSQTSVHSSSGTLLIRSNPLNILVTLLYNHERFDVGLTSVFPFLKTARPLRYNLNKVSLKMTKMLR